MKMVYIAIAVIGALILIMDSERAAIYGFGTILFLLPAALASIASFITSSISYNTYDEKKENICNVLTILFMLVGGSFGVWVYSMFFGSCENAAVKTLRNITGEIYLILVIYAVLLCTGMIDFYFRLPG